MTNQELKRLVKLHDRIMQIATEDLGIVTCPVEFDIVPAQKMIEIMACGLPVNISNWKFGRDYEILRTKYEYGNPALPYETIINSDPARAYLMKTNTFALNVLIIAHCVGHSGFFTMNEFFKSQRRDIIDYVSNASERFIGYEKKYGISEVEKIVDAGHALYLHSSPFDNETEEEKLNRVYNHLRKEAHTIDKSKFGILSGSPKDRKGSNLDIELFNNKLMVNLKSITPVESTEDLLRYIIDNSLILDDWSVDILEVLREMGRFFWPQMKTKLINEGFAVWVHEKIMNKLFNEKLLTHDEHAQFNYSNSLVKAESMYSINPYLIGSKILEDIEDRWNRGRHGDEFEALTKVKDKKEWDTKDGKGIEKVISIVNHYTDWFLLQDYLTADLVRDLKMFLYVVQDKVKYYEAVITDHEAEEVKKVITQVYANNKIPKIQIIDGNYENKGWLLLEHKSFGRILDKTYTDKTLNHIFDIWGKPVLIKTIDEKNNTLFIKSTGVEGGVVNG